jgi:hypothetical protein
MLTERLRRGLTPQPLVALGLVTRLLKSRQVSGPCVPWGSFAPRKAAFFAAHCGCIMFAAPMKDGESKDKARPKRIALDMRQFIVVVTTLNKDLPMVRIAAMFRDAYDSVASGVTLHKFFQMAER